MSVVWKQARVTRITAETPRIRAYDLASTDSTPLPEWAAGAHILVRLPSGLVRQYALVSDPDDLNSYRIAVLREAAGRGGSAEFHAAIRENDLLEISLPRNNFQLGDAEGFSLLIAGGIGITPILPMARELKRHGRDWRMVYCTRSLAETAFASVIHALGTAESVCLFHSSGSPANRLDVKELLQGAPQDSHIYVCGPRGLISSVVDQAASLGFSNDHIHLEAFSGQADVSPVPSASGRSFEIELRRSGKTLLVPPDMTILDVLEAAEVDVDSVCREGYCGTCLTKVLEGIPDHRDDDLLTPAERESNSIIALCCSRALSAKLALDL